MTYSQHEAIITQKGVDYPVVSDAIFSQTCKFAFKNRMVISILGKLLLNCIENAIGFRLGQLMQMALLPMQLIMTI